MWAILKWDNGHWLRWGMLSISSNVCMYPSRDFYRGRKKYCKRDLLLRYEYLYFDCTKRTSSMPGVWLLRCVQSWRVITGQLNKSIKLFITMISRTVFVQEVSWVRVQFTMDTYKLDLYPFLFKTFQIHFFTSICIFSFQLTE